MLNQINAFLKDLATTIRWADLLDVAFVAAFLYAFIRWVQASTSRSASRRTIRAFLLFAAVYGLARFLDLYLVEMLIKGLLAVGLLLAVVVFQSDIRRLFDRLGAWGPFRRPSLPPSPSAVVDVLTKAVAHMAAQKTGALIAIRGREAWDRQLTGGIELGGRISLPLLYSIFNPLTPGHDGAVLIEQDQVTKFAVHLPLSRNLSEVGPHGTRHTAALGLAESCDALVIVVSEENGMISVAEGNKLQEVASASDLKRQLESFWQRRYGAAPIRRRPWWRQLSLPTALLSLVLASLLWFLFAYQPDTVYRTFGVPIELRNLPSDWGLENPVPAEAEVTLSGSERAFRLMDPSSLLISLDLAHVEEGVNEFPITVNNLQLPSNISPYRVEPQVIHITAHKMQSVNVPVSVRTTGALPDSLELVAITSIPANARLLVAATREKQPDKITTAPVDLRSVTATTTIKSRLLPLPGSQLAPSQNADVTVKVEVRKKRRRR